MTETLARRASIIGERLFGLGEPDLGSGALSVGLWTEAPDGSVSRRDSVVRPDRPAGLVAVCYDAALSPYRFGLHEYDPFASLGASLDAAAERGGSLALAVWAAMEADLFRFAFDGEFTAALEPYRDSAEWRRFAALNDLYRAAVRAVAPLGAVPPGWGAWLRGDAAAAPGPFGRALGRLLTRPVVALAPVLRRFSAPDGVFYVARGVTC